MTELKEGSQWVVLGVVANKFLSKKGRVKIFPIAEWVSYYVITP